MTAFGWSNGSTCCTFSFCVAQDALLPFANWRNTQVAIALGYCLDLVAIRVDIDTVMAIDMNGRVKPIMASRKLMHATGDTACASSKIAGVNFALGALDTWLQCIPSSDLGQAFVSSTVRDVGADQLGPHRLDRCHSSANCRWTFRAPSSPCLHRPSGAHDRPRAPAQT